MLSSISWPSVTRASKPRTSGTSVTRCEFSTLVRSSQGEINLFFTNTSNFEYSSEYSRAAEELNDRGMKQFKTAVDSMKKRQTMMAIDWDDDGSPFIKEKGHRKSGLHQIESEDVVEDEIDVDDVMVPSQHPGKKLSKA